MTGYIQNRTISFKYPRLFGMEDPITSHIVSTKILINCALFRNLFFFQAEGTRTHNIFRKIFFLDISICQGIIRIEDSGFKGKRTNCKKFCIRSDV